MPDDFASKIYFIIEVLVFLLLIVRVPMFFVMCFKQKFEFKPFLLVFAGSSKSDMQYNLKIEFGVILLVAYIYSLTGDMVKSWIQYEPFTIGNICALLLVAVTVLVDSIGAIYFGVKEYKQHKKDTNNNQ